jgi:hypothetical protein
MQESQQSTKTNEKTIQQRRPKETQRSKNTPDANKIEPIK